MAMSLANLKSIPPAKRVRVEGIGLSLLVAIVAIMLGTSARRSTASMHMELARMRQVSEEISNFQRASGTVSQPNDSSRAQQTPVVGIARDVRLSLAQRIAAMAEESGLNDVRVRFASPDSAPAPAAPQISSHAPTIADYTLAVEAGGRFASVLSVVNHLPSSVALQRLRVYRGADGAPRYLVILAVFEAPGQNQHG